MAIKENVPINYTSRDFASIKNDLVEYTKKYYPDTFKDFNEASFGSLMLDTVAYTGDILSFYLDYQANESFLDTAVEFDNIIKHGRELGYKHERFSTAHGTVSFYILVPANTNGIGVDSNYIPLLRKGSTFNGTNGNTYILNEDVDFSGEINEVIAAKFDEDSSAVTQYAIKAEGQVIAGEITMDFVDIETYEPFYRTELAGGDRVLEILSVTDGEGHEWYEVDFLSQDIVFVPIPNKNADKATTPAILKLLSVPRRFVVEKSSGRTFLQFGYGSEKELTSENVSLKDPSELALKVHGRNHVIDEAFDPTNLISSDKFGVSPSNTTLQIVYRMASTEDSNASTSTISIVGEPRMEFPAVLEGVNLNIATLSSVVGSLEVNNESPITGDVSFPSLDEIKHRIRTTFPTQNRAVTVADYQNLIYRMPPAFGAVKKCHIIPDVDSFKRNLNVYILAEDAAGNLTTANNTLKSNIKTWLNQYKMINDTIDILDGHVVNVGIEFEVVSSIESNRFEILESASSVLKNFYSGKVFSVGENLFITDIYRTLNRVMGVADTTNVKIVQKVGPTYSQVHYNIEYFTSPDGRYIAMPENGVFEIKFPDIDIKGTIK
jgi:hypothetical protein